MRNNKKYLGIAACLILIITVIILIPEVSHAVELKKPIDLGSGDAGDLVATLLGRIISAVLGIFGSVALLIMIYGGITWITSSGNTEKISRGKNTLIWAFLGIIFAFGSFILVNTTLDALLPPTGQGGGGQEEASPSQTCEFMADGDPCTLPVSEAIDGGGICVDNTCTDRCNYEYGGEGGRCIPFAQVESACPQPGDVGFLEEWLDIDWYAQSDAEFASACLSNFENINDESCQANICGVTKSYCCIPQ